MSVSGIIVEPSAASDDDVVESWSHPGDDGDVLGVEAVRLRGPGEWPWQVQVCVAEFLWQQPLDVELVISVDRVIRSIAGVADVQHEQRDVWVVRGAPSGEELVQGVAAAMERFAARIRIYLEEP